MMTQDDHRAMFAHLRETTEKYFNDHSEKQMAPMAFKIKDGEMGVYLIASMKDEESKDAVAELMVKMVDEGAEAVAFMAESWRLPPSYIETLKQYPSIEANPNRQECVTLYYSTKWGDWCALADITRNEDPWGISFGDEEKAKLGDWDVIDKEFLTKAEGRFTNLWTRARALHAEEN